MSSIHPIPDLHFVTTKGVEVIVDNSLAPSWMYDSEPEPESRPPTVVVGPPPPLPEPPEPPPVMPARQRDKLVAELYAEHGAFLRRMLLRRHDILPESAQDLHQRTFIVLSRTIDKTGVPENPRGFLVGVMRREVSNHTAGWGPDIDHAADPAASRYGGPGPETATRMVERWEQLMRYLERLSPADADAFELVVLEGKTIAEAAAQLGRSVSTVGDQVKRARMQLAEFEEASRRAAELRERW